MAGELQYRTSDGALLYIESGADAGKLAYECCCEGEPECPSSCSGCCTNIKVTISGSTYDDGDYVLTQTGSCVWEVDDMVAMAQITCDDGVWHCNMLFCPSAHWVVASANASPTGCPEDAGPWNASEGWLPQNSQPITLTMTCND